MTAEKKRYREPRNQSSSSKVLHIMPLHDLREHIPLPECWCNPTVDEDVDTHTIYIHRSADGREDFEEGRRLPS
jgi:hypothetical protein